MPKLSAKRKRLDALRHPAILALRGVKIGPLWPPREELVGLLPGMRGVPRRKTKSPFNDKYRKERQKTKRQTSGYTYSKSGGKKSDAKRILTILADVSV